MMTVDELPAMREGLIFADKTMLDKMIEEEGITRERAQVVLESLASRQAIIARIAELEREAAMRH